MAASNPLAALKNLGPKSVLDLVAAGIRTPADLKRLGPEVAFLQILQYRHRNGLPIRHCNAIYLYALDGAIHDIDWREIPESRKARYRQLTADLRETNGWKSGSATA